MFCSVENSPRNVEIKGKIISNKKGFLFGIKFIEKYT
jgi:hypothetical protein